LQAKSVEKDLNSKNAENKSENNTESLNNNSEPLHWLHVLVKQKSNVKTQNLKDAIEDWTNAEQNVWEMHVEFVQPLLVLLEQMERKNVQEEWEEDVSKFTPQKKSYRKEKRRIRKEKRKARKEAKKQKKSSSAPVIKPIIVSQPIIAHPIAVSQLN